MIVLWERAKGSTGQQEHAVGAGPQRGNAPGSVASKRVVRHLQAAKDDGRPHEAAVWKSICVSKSARGQQHRMGDAPDHLAVGEVALQEQLLAEVGRLLDGRVGVRHAEDVCQDEDLDLQNGDRSEVRESHQSS
jgi:hypothetical protein